MGMGWGRTRCVCVCVRACVVRLRDGLGRAGEEGRDARHDRPRLRHCLLPILYIYIYYIHIICVYTHTHTHTRARAHTAIIFFDGRVCRRAALGPAAGGQRAEGHGRVPAPARGPAVPGAARAARLLIRPLLGSRLARRLGPAPAGGAQGAGRVRGWRGGAGCVCRAWGRGRPSTPGGASTPGTTCACPSTCPSTKRAPTPSTPRASPSPRVPA